MTHVPLTKTSVKLFSSPTTHSYAASSDRLHLLMVRVRLLPTLSNTYLDGDNGADEERERIMKECSRPEVSRVSQSSAEQHTRYVHVDLTTVSLTGISMVTGRSSRSP